ncbi:MAG: hypothetical protein NXI31_11995 [bacterium]|nr:hypothetical protein [bacterium]
MSWRRILVLSIVFVLALAGTTWAVLQRSDAATDMLRRKLDAAFATPATIRASELDLTAGRLVVSGLAIADPTRPETSLVQAERIDLDAQFDLGDLVALQRVTIHGLAIDLGSELPTIGQIFSPTAGQNGGDTTRLPAIDLTGGKLRIGCTPGEAPIDIADLALSATPVAGQPGRFALAGSGQVVGLGATVKLAGSVDTATGATDVLATIRDWPLRSTCLEWLEARLDLDVGNLDIAGTLDELEVAFQVTPADGANGAATPTQRLEVRGAVREARVASDRLPRHLRSATITFAASSDADGELALRIEQTTNGGGHLDLAADLRRLLSDSPSFTVRADGQDLQIDDDTIAALRLFDIGRNVVDALEPEKGRADIRLYLADPHLPAGIAEFDMRVRGGELAYHGYGDVKDRIGFALPLVDASGTVRLRDGIVELEDMSAKIAASAGGGDVTLTGRIDTMAAAVESTTLDIGATGIGFTDELRTALATLLGDEGELYDSLDPTGRADVDVTIRPMSKLAGGYSVAIRPRGATVKWNGFPYRLREIRGAIAVRFADAVFDLEGKNQKGSVTLHGRIPLAELPDSEPEALGIQIAVELEDLVIDDELRVAVARLAPGIDRPWQSFRPKGRCSGFVRAWQPRRGPDDEEEELRFDLRLDVANVELALPVEPWFARDLSGRLLLGGSGDNLRIDFDALRGRIDHGNEVTTELAMLGRIEYAEHADSDLSLVVRDLPLDAELGRALERLGALGEGTWDYLKPSGHVDLVCRHRLTPDGEPALNLVVHLLDVGSDLEVLPRPARNMTGELHVESGTVTFDEVRASLGDRVVRCLDGSISRAPAPDGRTRIAFTVKANGFPLSRDLANLFPGPLRQTIAERELSGTADIDHLAMTFAVPTAGSTMPFETVLGGQLRLQNVGLMLGSGKQGFRVERLYGNVTLDESRIGTAGGELVGRLSSASMQLFDQPFENLSGRFRTGPERMTLDALDGRLHGGVLRQRDPAMPAFVYTLPAPATPDGRLAASVAFEGIDVHSFLRTSGWEAPPYRGTARGHIDLTQLDGHDVVDARGEGALTIERADLGVVPLFTAIYSQVPAPERPRFNGLNVDWQLRERQFQLENLKVDSNLLSATGSGTVGLDGYVDVRLQTQSLLGNTADPLFSPFIEFFAGNFVRFHLFGHLRDLKAEQRWITERSPDRPPVPPLPPPKPQRRVIDY